MIVSETDKYKLGDQIKEYRQVGDLKAAIETCLLATKEYPDEGFFFMILGDLYFQDQVYDQATKAYIVYLTKISSALNVNNFLKRYARLKTVLEPQNIIQLHQQVISICEEPENASKFFGKVEEVIKYDYESAHLEDDINNIEAILNKKNFSFQEFLDSMNQLESLDKRKITFILDKTILNKTRNQKTLAAGKYSISLYEKFGEHKKAIQIATSILEIQKDPVIIRALFRLCRKINNYLAADIALSKHPDILKLNDFNILYELVYYFESQNDLEQVNNVLVKMEENAPNSIPIMQTIINFSLKFGMVEKASALREKIKARSSKNQKTTINETKYSQVLKESEEGIWSKIQELYSELDHQKQLAAISELTTGISHELGQPITNIRYTIQFYRELLKRENNIATVIKVFDSVLEETERMGNLIKRLSPLTSSKSLVQEFSVVELIKKRINAEEARLRKEKIKVHVDAAEEIVSVVFDPVKFEQVISNLLLNSIYSIKENSRGEERFINIKLNDHKDRVSLIFEDNGRGVPFEARRKIFEPFFTTKPPGEGEGLGLFIIWNILKMQGGAITLDPNYTTGARFIITIPR